MYLGGNSFAQTGTGDLCFAFILTEQHCTLTLNIFRGLNVQLIYQYSYDRRLMGLFLSIVLMKKRLCAGNDLWRTMKAPLFKYF